MATDSNTPPHATARRRSGPSTGMRVLLAAVILGALAYVVVRQSY
jgi:hypothetical protein